MRKSEKKLAALVIGMCLVVGAMAAIYTPAMVDNVTRFNAWLRCDKGWYESKAYYSCAYWRK